MSPTAELLLGAGIIVGVIILALLLHLRTRYVIDNRRPADSGYGEVLNAALEAEEKLNDKACSCLFWGCLSMPVIALGLFFVVQGILRLA